MTNNPAAIEFRHVSISFGDNRALDDLSFRLEHGQMICITGISGSGKSVVLRVASGLLVPDAGEVLVEGREITSLDEQELLALRSSFRGEKPVGRNYH
jgi:ABC-type transporter Mla maintaining outer membrane lipid asymmetry ATPase subunit MlaF